MRRKIAGVVLVILGAVLIGSALLLFMHNTKESNEAGEAAQELLADVQAAIEERAQNPDKPADKKSEAATEDGEITEDEMPGQEIMADTGGEVTAVYINGYDYIGYLTIHDLGLVLPVMENWSYEKLRIAPCRQFGSPVSDDLVIAAHNYAQHFGRLSSLKTGAPISFTDMNNVTHEYKVASIRQLEATNVEAVQNSAHDLVLYTCTYGGQSRVTVFCDRVG